MKIKYSYVGGGKHPKIGQIVHWRAEATDGPDASRYNRYMCDVLSAVAQDTGDCDRLLSLIARVENGHDDQIETGGNDVTMTMKSDGVQVDIEVNEDWIGQAEGHFTLQEWRAALEGWRRFLEMPASPGGGLEVDLPGSCAVKR